MTATKGNKNTNLNCFVLSIKMKIKHTTQDQVNSGPYNFYSVLIS